MITSSADWLSSFVAKRPKMGEILLLGEKNRSERLQLTKLNIYFDTIEAFLSQLDESRTLFVQLKDFSRVGFLLDRVRGDLEIAVEALLSGLHTTVEDVMRDMMETTYLLRDFFYEPNFIEKWLHSSDRERRTFFSPSKLRERQAKRQGISVGDLLDTGDYKAHSQDLHVNPFPPLILTQRGMDRTNDAVEFRNTLHDIIYHTDTLLIVIEAILHSQISDYPKRSNLPFWSELERQAKRDEQLTSFVYDTRTFIENQIAKLDHAPDENEPELAEMLKKFWISAYRIVFARALEEVIEHPEQLYAEGLKLFGEQLAARSDEYERDQVNTFRKVCIFVLQQLATMKWDETAVEEAVQRHDSYEPTSKTP